MNKLGYKYSIRAKLIFFLSLNTFIGLFIATTSTLVYYYFDEKEKVVNNNIRLAEVSGKNIAASLSFLDKESTEMILKPILNDKNIKCVKVYDNKGKMFISLGENKNGNMNLLKDKEKNISINWSYIKILTAISYKDENIGYLKISTSTDVIKSRMFEQLVVSFIIMFITLFVMFSLAVLLERMFSKPIFELLNAMRHIKNSNDFDIKLTSHTEDEFRELFDEFNSMADEIRKRDELLQKNNLSLQQLVDTTNKQLQITQNDLEKTSILAATDSLTSLYNRGYMMDKFDEMIEDAKKNRKYLGIIALDIDYFKSVNDSLGHHAGDTVLKELARILQKNARENDIVGRIGGEEFLILCKESDENKTFEIAQRLRKRVEDKPIVYDGKNMTQITISIGVYSSIPDVSKEELMKKADEALYISKNRGRNKVSIYGGKD